MLQLGIDAALRKNAEDAFVLVTRHISLESVVAADVHTGYMQRFLEALHHEATSTLHEDTAQVVMTCNKHGAAKLYFHWDVWLTCAAL
jgi:hypothetical protein